LPNDVDEKNNSTPAEKSVTVMKSRVISRPDFFKRNTRLVCSAHDPGYGFSELR